MHSYFYCLREKLLQTFDFEWNSALNSRLKDNLSVFERRYVDPGTVTNPSLMSLADRVEHRSETGVELVHRWMNSDLGGKPPVRKFMEREREELKNDLVKMKKLNKDGIIPEQKTTTWKRAVEKGKKIKEKLQALQKLTQEEKWANNCEAFETFLHDVWLIHHPNRNIYHEQEKDFWISQKEE